tara:strand:- start:1008 stop:1274 length:267 start_codon:yes stop_codon:yes gene_type:complete
MVIGLGERRGDLDFLIEAGFEFFCASGRRDDLDHAFVVLCEADVMGEIDCPCATTSEDTGELVLVRDVSQGEATVETKGHLGDVLLKR